MTGPTKRERTCIGCGTKGEKTTLHRLVRLSDGTVCFDDTGRLAGRGAYVCSKACFEAVNGTNKIQRSLRVSLNREDAERIAAELEAACSAQTS